MILKGSTRGWVAATALLLAAAMLVLVPTAPAAQAATGTIIEDFEVDPPPGFFEYSGGGATVAPSLLTIGDSDPLARPGQVGDNSVQEAVFDVTTGFGGFGVDFAEAGGSQDWSGFSGVSFWMYGTNSGNSYQFEIFDNGGANAERFDTLFTDDFSGWQQVMIPFGDFTRATDFQPAGAPDDGLTLIEMWGWAVPLDGNAGTLMIDDIALELTIIDDFESGLAAGVDGDGNLIGFFTFNDGNSTVGISTTTTPPAPVPGSAAGNSVFQMDADVTVFAGFIHAFENAAVDTWVTQDWSASEGFAFWLYGQNSGTDLFIDVIDNRNPGSTIDDAERWSVAFKDDFSGWQYLEFPFSDFSRKEIGNGAPNDGFGLTEVHGWAFGTLATGGPTTYYLDDVSLYGVAEIPPLSVTFASANFDVDEGTTGDITVSLNRPMNEDDPAQVSVDYSMEPGLATPGRDYTPTAGTLTFVKGGPSALTFPLETFDDNKWEPTERVILQLANPVDVEAGFLMQAAGNIINDDEFDPLLLDDFEDYPYLWDTTGDVSLDNLEIDAGDPMAVPGQGAYEGVLAATVPLAVDISVEGRVCNQGNGVIPVVLYTTDDFDATTVDHTTVTLGGASETHIDKKSGVAKRHEEDFDNDGDIDLVFHFRFNETGLTCDPAVVPFNGATYDGQPITGGGSDAAFGRHFAIGQDWSGAESLAFWYYGQGTGDEIGVELLDNRAPDPGPAGWSLVWADEFDDPAGTPPNPDNWGYEIGDGTVNGIPGWGNDELQYYTDDPANAATDGLGNLVITAAAADGSLQCYYGPCDYTSARLVTKNKAEFAYGRIESRILVPDGEAGLWPAFWSLGTDIDLVNWPQTGEIDFMEYVSRLPNEIFGTIHGPGYSGGASFGNVYDFGEPVYNDYHTFTIEWEPNLMRWYVDGILYHTATPADVAPNPWVFNDPVYFLLNLALGGNFGGALDPNLTFPQSMAVDYVRVYQGPDTAERFEASFVDDFAGWQEVTLPFTAFTRSTEQPDGAPNDGLTLTDVWGYGFDLPGEGSSVGTLWLDQVRPVPIPPPTGIVVTNLDNSGAGSLRQAIEDIADGGTITFDPSLAGGTVNLFGPIALSSDVTIDAGDAPGVALDGGGADRVLIVDAGVSANVSNMTMTNGYGFQLAGCVLNNGALTLDHVTVTGCLMTTDAGDFWQGGGGIYNGDGASLELVDSTVSNNSSGWTGGGVYSFFNTTTTVVRSTISGNVAIDVGGGMRTLGTVNVDNSTLSDNTSTAWHGGAMFITDGVVNVTNSTVTANNSPGGTTGGLFVGPFTDASATLNLQNTIVAGNANFGCLAGFFGAGAVALNSLGNNVFTDGTCGLDASDQIVADAGLDGLADNGGPTLTHALQAGSPAIDTANVAVCPPTDQRGVPRPQGAGCDVGAFEYTP